MKTQIHMWALLAVGAVSTYLHKKANVPENVHHSFMGLLAMGMTVVLRSSWAQGELKSLASGAMKIAGASLALLSFGGCSLTPAQIQTDTTVAVNLGLNGAVIFDKAKASEIQSDAIQVAQAIDAVVIPTFQPGATAGGLLNSSVSQAMMHLQARLSSLKHGSEILGIISLLQAPLAGALGATASPTALLPPSGQANALAFFIGVSRGIAQFSGYANLAPPVPAPAPPSVPK